MKIFNIFGFVVLLSILLSCNSKDAETWPQLRNESYSLCDELRSTETTFGGLKEEIHYQAIDNQTLRFDQSITINCACENIEVKMTAENNTVVINVHDYGISANCFCPGAVTYDVGNLQENTTYTFVFQRKGEVLHTENITFTAGTDQSIIIN
jgi:hypothetical protein